MKKTILYLLSFILLISIVSATDIGYNLLDNNKVLHIWNTQDNYYFNTTSGIQLTNHYNDYWTKNVFCIGYYASGTWNKIRCSDELSSFNKNVVTDNVSYVNATLWKDFSYAGYDIRLGVQYHLGLDDDKLSVTIYGKNIGVDIPVDLGFGWIIKDVDIPGVTDYININNSMYNLNDTFDIVFKKYNGNETLQPKLSIQSDKFLTLDWSGNLNYAVKMYSNGTQESFYVATLINAGHLSPGQEKQTTLYWIDADYEFKILGELIDSTNLNGARFVEARGDCAYVIGYAANALNVIDISDPTNPTVEGTYISTSGDYNIQCPYSLAVDSTGSYAYVASLCSHRVVRLALPANCDAAPTANGFYYSESGNYNLKNAAAVAVSEDDTRLYVGGYNANNIVQFDIESSGNPVPTGHYASATYVVRPIVTQERNGYVYVTGDGTSRLTVLDATDPDADMTLAGSTTGGTGGASLSALQDVVVSDDDYAFTVTYSNCIAAWDVTAHGTPSYVGGECDVNHCAGARAIAISDDGNFVGCAASAGDRVVMFNVTARSTPIYIKQIDNSADCGLDNVYGVGFNNDYFFSVAYNEKNFCTYEARINTTGPTDTCTYGGSGNWFINLTDNCVLTDDTEVDGVIDVQGEGHLTIRAIIHGLKLWFRPTNFDGTNVIAVESGDLSARK